MERIHPAQVIGVGVAAGALLAIAVMAGAQTVAPPKPSPRPVLRSPGTTTFDQLSPGNQKIARAIFEAQKPPATGAGAGTTAPKPLTLDQIAAMKQRDRGWGNIFKDLKQRGLVQDKNLGGAVSRFEKHHGGSEARSDSRNNPSAFAAGRGHDVAERGFGPGNGGFIGGGGAPHGGGRGR